MRKKDLLNTDKNNSAIFKYDFDAISKSAYYVNPNEITVSKTPFKFDFFHDTHQQKYISNSVKLYSGHSRGLGMVYARSNMKQMYRSFKSHQITKY